MKNLLYLINKTNEDIKNLKKPLSVYQYYTLEWDLMSEQKLGKYINIAEKDKIRYNKEKINIEKKLEDEILKLKIYICNKHTKMPCVGFDNGFTYYTISGPVVKVELFNKNEIDKLKTSNFITTYNDCQIIPKYKSIYVDLNKINFNTEAFRNFNIIAYGGNYHRSTWYTLIENYIGETGEFCDYISYDGHKWTEKCK
jgi:hypothetical protein|tara:strand:- start:652 stop:1245 length:594 start_codon:yes stop_codon:yes gene_type:complete